MSDPIPPGSFVRINRPFGIYIPPKRVGELAYVPRVGPRGYVEVRLRGDARVFSLPPATAARVLGRPYPEENR